MSIIARISTRFLKTALAATTVAVAVAGCTSDKWGFPYRAPIQQGNWITQEQIALLQPGMTREQVRFALGSPTLISVLHADRWDYPYYFKPGYGKPQERKFTVWFDNDLLTRWEGDKQPDLQPFQLDAEGKPQEKIDEQIDVETARQNAEVPIRATLPGGALPPEGAHATGSDPQRDTTPLQSPEADSEIRAPSMSESDESASQTTPDSGRQREFQLNAPMPDVEGTISPSINDAEPLR